MYVMSVYAVSVRGCRSEWCVCVCACVRACVRACVGTFMSVCVDFFKTIQIFIFFFATVVAVVVPWLVCRAGAHTQERMDEVCQGKGARRKLYG